ncbi:MAG: hypothetical protein MUC63_06520 [Planctomycetes bacterium]|jgi:hypothetical protein|nr:hypothetical protein [Planctomycetota bacterium]
MIRKGLMIAAGALCLAGAAFLVYLIVRPSGERGPELPPVRMRLARRLAPEAVRDMRGKLPPTFGAAVLLQFQGHRNALDLRKIVREEIEGSGALQLKELDQVVAARESSKGLEDRAREWAEGLLASALGKPAPKADVRVTEALRAAKLDGYVGALVSFLEDSPDAEKLDLTLYALDPEGREVFRKAYTAQIRKSFLDLEYYRLSVAQVSWVWRLLLWAVAVVALPVVTFFAPRAAIRSQVNGWILAALAAYTVLDGVAALALMGFAIPGAFSLLVLLLALGLGGFYNWAIFTEIKDLS